MANGDGFSEVGGGGSVLYQVKVKNGNAPDVVPPDGGPQQRVAHGRDAYEAQGEETRQHYFEVRIKLPEDGRLRARIQAGALFIYLPIDKTFDPGPNQPKQVRVSWAVRNLPAGLSDLALPSSVSTT